MCDSPWKCWTKSAGVSGAKAARFSAWASSPPPWSSEYASWVSRDSAAGQCSTSPCPQHAGANPTSWAHRALEIPHDDIDVKRPEVSADERLPHGVIRLPARREWWRGFCPVSWSCPISLGPPPSSPLARPGPSLVAPHVRGEFPAGTRSGLPCSGPCWLRPPGQRRLLHPVLSSGS